jgi:hypothetical protein
MFAALICAASPTTGQPKMFHVRSSAVLHVSVTMLALCRNLLDNNELMVTEGDGDEEEA